MVFPISFSSQKSASVAPGSSRTERHAPRLPWPFSRLGAVELYVILAATLVLSNARVFYGYLHAQTEHVALWFNPSSFEEFIASARRAPWSAPLDDVFIHFDFARSTARGFPFQWSEGNGYSSGGTSLLYPFVLALGYLVGYRDLRLMLFAAIIACVSVFATLLWARRLFSRTRPALALILPPLFLSVGGLNWTLFSGMEVALFLAAWSGCFVLWDDFLSLADKQQSTRGGALLFGLSLLILVAIRPEAAPLVAIFGISAAWPFFRAKKYKSTLECLLILGVPSALLVVTQYLVNKALTGDGTAAGGISKLELHHPYMTGDQIFHAWLNFVRYQFERLSLHHLSGLPGAGFLFWPLGLSALFFASTRRYAALLWVSMLVWTALVALNGQVRWQNERYAMPTVAWLLMTSALGVAGAIHALLEKRSPGRAFGTLLSALTAIFLIVQAAPRFRDQVWFFGRASRNILEQHVRTGEYLERTIKPRPRRVLLSDAGAIPYASDISALDLIGLGGYRGLPFARATRLGVGASVELLERLPKSELPDIMALYPTWWGDFPLWFGRPLASFPVRGNVICGGTNMQLYVPDWTPLEQSGLPFAIKPNERVLDELDVADIINEKAHEFSLSHKAVGFVDMKVLPDPRAPHNGMFDAGRILTGDVQMRFTLGDFRKGHPASLLVRVAPARDATLAIEIGGRTQRIEVPLEAKDVWQEVRVALPELEGRTRFSVSVPLGATHIYHIFAVEPSETASEPSGTPPLPGR
ncbi:MAG: hypothetical protein B6A08_01760 [Sorangiineae bacterium NIC37A_2]|nr:MAG: hypothetical protein B6A08_01760 [Sorangiineae bacterium NIC37A_2]